MKTIIKIFSDKHGYTLIMESPAQNFVLKEVSTSFDYTILYANKLKTDLERGGAEVEIQANEELV